MDDPGNGFTPVDRDDLAGLIPHVTTQSELNEVEAANILDARVRAVSDRGLRRTLLTPRALCRLHRMMFDRVWTWAGRFRTRDPNIGSDWEMIPDEVAQLCADVRAWLEYRTYDWPTRAVRFHHRLVRIHPFPNGNGRHARLAADLLLHYNGRAMLNWAIDRSAYISALQSAEDHDYRPLLELIRPLGTTTRGDQT